MNVPLWLRRTLTGAALTGGLLLAGATTATPAHADVLDGGQVKAPVSAPVTVSGNAVSVLGDSKASRQASPAKKPASGGSKAVRPRAAARAAAAPQPVRRAAVKVEGEGRVARPSTSATARVNVQRDERRTTPAAQKPQRKAAVTARASSARPAAKATVKVAAAPEKRQVDRRPAAEPVRKARVASGNQVDAPVSAPVTVCGNSAAVAGRGSASCGTGGTSASRNSSRAGGSDSSADGAASGNRVNAPVTAPVTVCGNSVAALGSGSSSCSSPADSTPASTTPRSGSAGRTDGEVASGNQVDAPVNAPVTVCGNSVGVAGRGSASCDTSAPRGSSQADDSGSRASGAASGNQVDAPVNAPVTVCGNSVAALGSGSSSCSSPAGTTPASTTPGSGSAERTDREVASGNQVDAPVTAPVTVCGNSVAALGSGSSSCSSPAGTTPASTTSGNNSESGIVSGNNANAPVTVPVTACGNSAGVLGSSTANCAPVTAAGTPSSGTPAGGNTSDSGIVSGNNVNAPVTAPVTVCGNGAAVLGDGSASCGVPVDGGTPTSSGTSPEGTDVFVPVTAPVTVCGNGAGVAGSATASCGVAGAGAGSNPEAPTPTDPPVKPVEPGTPDVPADPIEDSGVSPSTGGYEVIVGGFADGFAGGSAGGSIVPAAVATVPTSASVLLTKGGALDVSPAGASSTSGGFLAQTGSSAAALLALLGGLALLLAGGASLALGRRRG